MLVLSSVLKHRFSLGHFRFRGLLCLLPPPLKVFSHVLLPLLWVKWSAFSMPVWWLVSVVWKTTSYCKISDTFYSQELILHPNPPLQLGRGPILRGVVAERCHIGVRHHNYFFYFLQYLHFWCWHLIWNLALVKCSTPKLYSQPSPLVLSCRGCGSPQWCSSDHWAVFLKLNCFKTGLVSTALFCFSPSPPFAMALGVKPRASHTGIKCSTNWVYLYQKWPYL